MKRIRIGKDISMRWEITTDGVAIPLDGRDLTVEIKSPTGIENNIPYRIDGNILIMTYYGYEQKRTGEYSITLWEKKGKLGQNVVDVIRAFELVRTSQEENDFVGGDLQIESVDLGTGNFDILTEGGYRAINIDTLQAEALEDSVNIKGKTYSNESFTITLPKANLDSAGVMSADDKHTLKEHGNRIAQINTTLEEHTESINARITTDRIADGAVTSEKIATSAFDSTLSVSGKIAPADTVGERLTELEREINGNVFDLGGYWKYKPIIEQGNFSKYGIIGQTEGWWRMVLPVNFKNATKFKVTPTSNSVTYQFVYLLTNAYPTAASDASRPLYNIITGEETEFDLNDVIYVALCWRDNNNLGATMEDALKMVSINVHSTLADANKVNSLWNKNSVITGKNLFDVSKQVMGYLDASGNLINGNNYRTSDFMPVAGLSNIVISDSAQNGLRHLLNAIIHSYDKNGKWKTRLSSGASSISIPSSTVYIRISYRYYSTWDMAVQVENGSIPTEYERYYTLNQLDDSVFSHNVNLEKDPSKLQIVCWGDSLTYGQGGTNYQYPSKLRDYLPNAEIKNFGTPGEKSMAIACRQGAYPIIADPFNIPASGGVNITIKDVNGNSFTTLKHNGVRDNSVYIENIAGINGILRYSGGNYNFVRAFAGDAVSVDRPVTFKMYGTHFREWLPIIWAGTNDAPTSANAEEIIKIVEGMVKYSNSDKFLVIGLTHQGRYPAFKNTFNAMLGTKFGVHFINLLEYLKNYGLADNGLIPTAQDTTDIANNLVPTSLRSDSVHFNDYGYIATAKCVYLKGKDLGYWE